MCMCNKFRCFFGGFKINAKTKPPGMKINNYYCIIIIAYNVISVTDLWDSFKLLVILLHAQLISRLYSITVDAGI